MKSKGSVALDWMLSAVVFVSVMFFSVWSVYSTYISNNPAEQSNNDEVCKKIYAIYKGTCNENTYLLRKQALFSPSAPTYIIEEINQYAILIKKSANYSFRECDAEINSDVVFNDEYVNNTFISYNVPNRSLSKGSQYVAKIYSPVLNNIEHKNGIVYIKGNDSLVVLPHASEVLFLGKEIIMNTTYFDWISIEGEKQKINIYTQKFQNIKNLCIYTPQVLCFEPQTFMNAQIYNNSYNMSIKLQPINKILKIHVGGAYDECITKEKIKPFVAGVYYEEECLKNTENKKIQFGECNYVIR